MAEPADPGEITQRTQALQRRRYELVGAWVLAHWSQLLSALGGALVGAGSMYLAFAAQVHAAHDAATDAKSAAMELKASVAQVQGTINQLVTQRELQPLLRDVQELKDWEGYARGWQPPKPLAERLPRPVTLPRRPPG